MKTFEQLRIIYYGTPDFAVASLDALVSAGANIVAVVTAPDKPSGRGMQMQSSAVKQYAVEKGLYILQPLKMKDESFLEELRALKADIQIVVAFRMMPEVVWDMPPLGTINVHGSMLPQYRGAAPINRAIMNGETETGVTTFKLKHQIDTGDILLQQKVSILPEDTAGTLHDKLMEAGAALLVRTVKGIAEGTLKEIPQESGGLAHKHAPKIFKDDTIIDWDRPVSSLQNFIRGLSPYPAAHTSLAGKSIKIFSAEAKEASTGAQPGAYDTDRSTYLRFAAKDGWLYIKELQQEGKKRMNIVDYLRGFRG